MHSGQLPNLLKSAVRAVELERIAHILLVVVVGQLTLMQVVRLKISGGFEAPVRIRHHIGDEDIGIAVVVEVGGIGPHGEMADMAHPLG